MRIGELSKRTGISVRMLRYYETEGILSPARTDAGYRRYGSRDEETVRLVKLLGAAGMTLPVIRMFLPCALEARGEFEPCDELHATVEDHIEQVDRRIKDLKQSRTALGALLGKLQPP